VTEQVPELILRLLERRGVVGKEAVGRFFSPSLSDLECPEALPGTVEATDVILDCRGKTVVFGDYDCDGVCATAILVSCLRTLVGSERQDEIVPFLPERLSEGYGMSDASVARMLAENPDVRLVITVDNGINSVDQVAGLKAKGVRVVVTDHHLPGEILPEADALVDPKVRAPASLVGLCGAGVAFLLARRLVNEARSRGIYDGPNIGGPLLILAGLATVTDIMPLVGQNRILVAEALKRFRQLAPVGLRELLDRAAKSAAASLTSKDFGFLIGPRINAAGRVASGMAALELILTDDREIARECARIVDAHNVERKTIEQKMTEEALSQVVAAASAQVIDLPTGHPGVAGIVAARVLERLEGRVPVCVIAGGHGSARSPEGINIRDAFEHCRDLLTTYGGHAAAGGFSVRDGQVGAFRERLNEYCSRLVAVCGKPCVEQQVDAWVEPGDLSVGMAEWVSRMEPFGEGNPNPVFGLRDVVFVEARPLGQDGRHLQVTIGPAEQRVRKSHCMRAVWWNHGDLVEELRRTSHIPHTVCFTVELSDYGERHVELRLVSVD